MEPATRRPAPRPMLGGMSALLPTQVKGTRANVAEKSTGGQGASSDQQLSYAEVSKPSGTMKPTAKGTVTAAVPAACMDAAPRRTSPGACGNVFGPLSVTPKGTTLTTAHVENCAPPWCDETKPRYTYRMWGIRGNSSSGFALRPRASYWPRWKVKPSCLCRRLLTASGPLAPLCGPLDRATGWVFTPFSWRTNKYAYCGKIYASACPRRKSRRSWRLWT
jgi:hypothetical protein